ncbi:hypothetical protein [uncultured Porphyromonas sp.]|uniref:hypothetical protein n=1 Tax=uncultured Porphyromonas sp. TaxID=159274 RepID=UPI00260C76CC|nr:hypothetical protein [uncultured Porphyromonas sp.]
MKRILLTLLLIGLLPLSQFAQTPTEEPQYIMKVHLKGEQPILVPVDKIDSVQFIVSDSVLTPAPLPLEYVLEYNVDSIGTALVTTHATDVSGYFTFEDAVAKFSDITIAGNEYHLPSTAEWCAIIPALQYNDKLCAKFDKSDETFMDVSEKVVVQGDTIISNNDYRLGVNKVTYGLRFKGTQMLSAWRYEYTKVDDCQVLKITARPVASDLSIEKVADPLFWESDTDADVIRYFPASGYKMADDGNVLYGGSDGSFWTATTKSDKNAWGMYFYYEEAHLFDLSPRSFLRSVRLFLGK